MKKQHIGLFFGKNLYLETEDNDTLNYAERFENWVGTEKANAVQEYKDELFFKDLEIRHPKHPTFFTGLKEFLNL